MRFILLSTTKDRFLPDAIAYRGDKEVSRLISAVSSPYSTSSGFGIWMIVANTAGRPRSADASTRLRNSLQGLKWVVYLVGIWVDPLPAPTFLALLKCCVVGAL